MSSRRRRKVKAQKLPKKSVSSKKSSRKSGKKSLWWKVLLGLFVVLIGGGFIGYKRAIAYLHSDDFRKTASLQVTAQMGCTGGFGDFTWDGLSGKNTGFNAESDGMISKVEVEDIAVDVDLDFIKRDKFELNNIRVNKVHAELDMTKPLVPIKLESRKRTWLERRLPDQTQLNDATAEQVSAVVKSHSGDYKINGLLGKVVKNGSVYDVTAEGGEFILPLPLLNKAQLRQAKMKLDGNDLYINEAQFSVFDSGKLDMIGFVDFDEHAAQKYELEGKLTGLKCSDLISEDWQQRLKGEVEGKLKVAPYIENRPKLSGNIKVKNGTIEALPVLDKVAYYLADKQYRSIKFERFDCDFEKVGKRIVLSNVQLTSKGVIQVEGKLVINDQDLNGLFLVGLPVSKLRNIPGAEQHVFVAGKDQLHWTTVKISGTLDDIKEDLSDRMIAAAQKRIIDIAKKMTGEVISPGRVKDATNVAGEAFKLGNELLNGNKSVGDMFNLLRGGGKTPKDTENKEKNKKEEDKEEKEEGLLPKVPKVPNPIELLPF